MRNRVESLSNQTFKDPTAWKAIRNAGKEPIQQSPKVESRNPQTARITELNQHLASLWQQKKEGLLASSEYRIYQREIASKLHEAMIKAGYKPIRTKKNS